MKIAIITLLDYKNYGNRLQNYAMNRLIRSLGYDTRNLYFWSRAESGDPFKEAVKRMLPSRIVYGIQRFRAYEITSLTRLKRVLRFQRFSRRYTPVKLIIAKGGRIRNPRFLSEYDYFAAGSDQIWNPFYVADEMFFLSFARPSQRLALMASFGTEAIPEKLRERYAEWLRGFSYISVRESSAVDLIRDLNGRNAELFPDPTLLVERWEWNEIMKKPQIELPQEFALAFFFGAVPRNVCEACEKKGIPLLRANDEGRKELYALDPAEMLFLIQNAKFVFTDSFHITALSIKLNRQFYVFNREKFPYMFTRIRSILEMFDVTNCAFCDARQIENWRPVSEEKYQRINRLLEEERNRFLKRLLAITQGESIRKGS